MKRVKVIFSIFLICLSGFASYGREDADTVATAGKPVDYSRIVSVTDSLIKDYKFKEALEIFEDAKSDADSLGKITIDEAMVQAQNGYNMTGFCSSPVTVAKERFSLKDFFLYYPLQNKSWRSTPNQLDSTGGPFARALYLPSDAETIYWSAKDSDNIRNICRSSLRDTLWSVPELVNEQITSSADEIYPMVSPDGTQLFFASKGLYGMGGYDLYVSNWDNELNDWGVPVNMGFPYSSPYDDFLYINTSDGRYSIFASNRECSADSVYIYVLEYDSMPVRTEIRTPDELRNLCTLKPANDPTRMDNASATAKDIQDNDETHKYTQKMLEVRSLRDSIFRYSSELDKDRSMYAQASDEEKAKLQASILSREAALPGLQDSLARVSKELQDIELNFLKSGVVINPEKLQKEADREVVGVASAYTFKKNELGKPITLDMEKPKPSFDYTFQILPEGRFAEDNTLPEGLVYQIQLFSLSTKATVKQIKGLSPVFERIGSTGKHIYSVGLFHSYKDVLANLNKVKRVGFRSAVIVAFQNGKTITVPKAREMEKSIHELFQVRIFPANGSALSETELTAVRSASDTDMVRDTEGGIISFIVGPFDSSAEAESLASELRKNGLMNLRVESAGISKIE